MAEKKKKKKTAKKKNPRAEIKVVPEFYDKDGQLRTLKQGNFPNSKEGKLAYCDFQIEKWKVKKVVIEKRLDPLSKKKRKRDKLEEQLTKLNEELKAEEEAVD